MRFTETFVVLFIICIGLTTEYHGKAAMNYAKDKFYASPNGTPLSQWEQNSPVKVNQ